MDAYLGDLLAEMYEGGRVGAHKVTLRMQTSKVFAPLNFGQQPVTLRQPAEQRQELAAVHPDLPAHQATIRHH
ncbi:hypothetical protein D3C77_701590 [compost metagenome]